MFCLSPVWHLSYDILLSFTGRSLPTYPHEAFNWNGFTSLSLRPCGNTTPYSVAGCSRNRWEADEVSQSIMGFGSLNKQMKSGPKMVINVNFRKDVFWIGSPWFTSSQDKVHLRSYTLSMIWGVYIVRSYMNVFSCSCPCLVLHHNRTTDCLTSSSCFVPVPTHEC